MKPPDRCRFLLAASLALAAAACTKEGPRAPAPGDGTGAQAAEPQESPGSSTPASGPVRGPLLELGVDAIRDLRLTLRRAEQRPAGDTVNAVGSTEYDPSGIASAATRVEAQVVRMTRSVGERVERGDLLAVLRSVEVARLQAAAQASEAAVAIAKSRVELARRQHATLRDLQQAKLATIKEVQAAELEVGAREADLAQAELAAKTAAQSLAILGIEGLQSEGAFELRAPSAGLVTLRDGAVGQTLEASHELYRLAATDSIVGVVHPFERDGLRLDASASVRVFAAAYPGRSFDATFLRAGAGVDPVSRTLPIYLRIANPDGALRAGMSLVAECRIAAAAAKEVVSVPIAAVQRIDRDWCVFVPRGPGRFERRVIARGRDLGGEVEVLEGLAAGEEVVVEGAFVLRSESTRGADSGDEHDH